MEKERTIPQMCCESLTRLPIRMSCFLFSVNGKVHYFWPDGLDSEMTSSKKDLVLGRLIEVQESQVREVNGIIDIEHLCAFSPYRGTDGYVLLVCV